jgi:hypothetical protein
MLLHRIVFANLHNNFVFYTHCIKIRRIYCGNSFFIRILKTSLSGTLTQVISLEDLLAGFYFIRLMSEGIAATLMINNE